MLDKMMSDQLEEVERELYKHVGCKMFHSAGVPPTCCANVCVCVFLDAYVSNSKCEHVRVCILNVWLAQTKAERYEKGTENLYSVSI